MTDSSRDLLKSFGKLLQNRAFLMAVGQQAGMGGHGDGGPGGRRGQGKLLKVLAQSPHGLTNAEIAEILDIRPSSVSATISRLVDAGFVERIPSATDKRAVIVRLSDKGRDLFARYDERVDSTADDLFGGLTPDEQQQLDQLLTKLAHQLDDLDWGDYMGHMQGWPHRGMGGMGRHPHF
ncbi:MULTISPECIES: MarR family winged helix-turn-helix transcriptional regulator [Lactobacillaceae]|uniref:MarR family winged helix-turn-helix transcriptional regulator n=1 Tax=Lactobacillaceae TaxID=33958 RepID=UPI0014572319|nr:MarR family transcriptional regulator [Lactobacillus sp. HBUAS51381]NLR09379.1 MarR family transcriptional regulator [Lactobacillus sp. HBUAS51381]